MHIQTSLKAELFMHTLRMTILGVFAVFISAFVLTLTLTTQTEAATSSDINFQARLENATGSIANDGTYNVEFKLYNTSAPGGGHTGDQGACTYNGGTTDPNCLWTEDYLVSAGHSAQVVNGYLTVNLGSITAFPTNMNWNQQLWLTMRIGGTGSSPTWDTEMSPRLLMTGTAYSFQAGQLSYTNSTYVGTLSFNSTLSGTDNVTIPDASGTVCLQNATACGFAPTTGSTNYIQNQNSSVQTTANFKISGTGQAAAFDNSTGATLNIGTTTATGVTIGQANNSALVTVNDALVITGVTPASGNALNVLQATAGNGSSGTAGGKGGGITLQGGSGGAGSITNGNGGDIKVSPGNPGITTGVTAGTNGLFIVFNADEKITYGNLQFTTQGDPSAPSVATNGAGNLTGIYKYKVTFVTDAGYETDIAAIAGTVTDATNQNLLTSIAVGGNGDIAARRIYRTLSGGSNYYLVTTILDDTTTSYSDNATDASISSNVQIPQDSDTAGAIIINGTRSGLIAQSGGTAIGYQALPDLTAANSTAFGDKTLQNATAGDNYALALGFRADICTITNCPSGLSNVSSIGYNAMASQNDSLVLGAYTGNGSFNTSVFQGNDVQTNVGIGTATPSAVLTVVGIQPGSVTLSGVNAPSVLGVTGAQGGNITGTGGGFAGTGSAISLASGNGGNSSATSGTSTAGAGGSFTIQAGNGGVNSFGTATNGSGGSITLSAGAVGTGGTGGSSGSVIIKNQANSTTAFIVQNTSSATVLNVDTSNSIVTAQGINSAAVIVGGSLLSGNCSGTNWSGSGTGPYTHTSGSTTALTCTLSPATTIGAIYEVSYTVTGATSTETYTPKFGGVNGQKSTGNVTTMIDLVTATSATASATFTPSLSTSTAAITSIAYYTVTPSNNVLAVKNSDGSVGIEIRSGGSGSTNTFIGVTAGEADYTGLDNVAVGVSALQYNTTGSNNTALGIFSLQYNTTGGNNTAQGVDSLENNTTGGVNTAQGQQSLQLNTTGSGNTAQGMVSLQNNTSGTYNSAIGYLSLASNTTGSYNAALGYAADVSSGSLQNATSVGAGAIAGANDTLVLGTTSGTYLTGSDIQTSVGIGTSTPGSILTVTGLQPASGNAKSVLNVTGGTGAGTATAGNGGDITLQSGNGGNGATANGNGGNITLSAGLAGSGAGTAGASGSVIVKNQANSTTAFQIQNAASATVLATDTTANTVNLSGNFNFSQVSAPSSAPTVATGVAGALTGTYYYVVTYATASGQTGYGPVSSSVAPSSQKVNLTAIPTSPSNLVTARDIYRGTATGGPFNLVGTINDNTTTILTDNNTSPTTAASQVNQTTQLQINGTPILIADITSNNIALGQNDLQVTTSGGNNNAFGYRALKSDTSGNNNNAFGYNALYNLTTTSNNNAFGFQSLYSTTSSDNNGYGYQSLFSNTSGANNSALGYKALYNNTTGSDNTALGFSAGWQDENGNFVSGAALQNATAIGAYAQVQSSNSIVLGSVDNATSVGIGTTIPLNTFSVSPVIYSTGTACSVASSGSGTCSGTSTTFLFGTSTTWTASMVGDELIFADGQEALISAVTSTTAITLNAAVNEATGSFYRIHTLGFNVTSAGNAFVQNTSTTAFQIQNASGAAVLSTDTTANTLNLSGNFNFNSVTNATAPTFNSFIGSGALTGTYYYVVTYVTNSGQTGYGSGGISSSISPSAQNVVLNIPTSSSNLVISRDIYRSTSGNGPFSLVGTVGDNTSTTFTDSNTSPTIFATDNNTTYDLQLNGSSILTVDNNNYNTALGASFNANTTGTEDSSLGYGALHSNTTGGSNAAVGYYTLHNNTTGSSNAAVGFYALSSNTTSGSNTAIGSSALRTNTGSDNSALGYSAGYQDSGGNFVTTATIQYATAIGAFAQVQASNSIVLGSVDTATNVGIGTTIPLNTFSVSPMIYSTGTACDVTVSGGSTCSGTTDFLFGTGTTWTASMVGDELIFADGQESLISAVTSTTAITLASSVDEPSGSFYRIHVLGLQVTSSGTTYVQNTATNAFQVLNAAAATVLNVDSSNSIVTAQGNNSLAIIGGTSLLSGNCSGTNWSGSGTGPYLHATGSTAVLTCTLSPATTIGSIYEVSYTVTGATSTETFIPKFGGVNGLASTGNVTTYETLNTATNATVNATFKPSLGTSTASIISIAYYTVTPASNVFAVKNSDGSAGVEIRSGGSGQANTFIGIAAGEADSSGSFNVAIGASALQSNTTGQSNTAQGYQSLQNNTTGGDNVAQGLDSLLNNTTGSDNNAQGVFSLQNNTTGSFNTAQGAQSLQANTTGTDNAAQGDASLLNNTTGTGNTAQGDLSLQANTTGSYNTGLGYGADVSSGSLQNATSVGAGAIAGANDSLVLGTTNGTYLSGTDIQTSIGIGTTTPGSILTVTGLQPASGNAENVLSVTGGTGAATATAGNGAGITLQSGNGGNGATDNGDGGNVTLSAGLAGSGAGTAGASGSVIVKNQANSTTAFIVQNTSTASILNVDTTNGIVTAEGTNSIATISGAESGLSCSGTNWSGSGTYTHASGSVAPLICTFTAGVINGDTYQVIYTTGSTNGTENFTPAIGGVSGPATTGNVTSMTDVITATATTSPQFTPSLSTSTATISSISYYLVTPSTNVLAVKNSDSSAGIEIRSGGSGLNNTFIGVTAGEADSTGVQNVAIGVSALQSNTTGSNNAAQGYLSLKSNTSGSDNIAQGYGSLQNNTTGGANTAIGVDSQFDNTTGSDNTAQGASSLLSNTTGSYNAALGYSADVASGSLQNATAVGAGAIAGANDSLVLGTTNGTYLSGTDIQTSIGIGTTTPGSILTVTGLQPATGNAKSVLNVTGGTGAGTATAGNGGGITLQAGNGGNGSTANGNGANITLTAGIAGTGAGSAGVAGQIIFIGHIESTQTTAPTSGTPANCATSPSSSVLSGSTDSAGQFTINVGTTGGTLTTCATVITFNQPYASTPKAIMLTAVTSNGGGRQTYISAAGTGSFTVSFNSAPGAGAVVTFYYWVIE